MFVAEGKVGFTYCMKMTNISIKIGQYTHTANYDLEDINHNKNLMTNTLEIMGGWQKYMFCV